LICLMISGDEYKLWSSSMCNFLHSLHPVPRLCVVFRNKYLVLWGRVVSPPPNPQAGGPPIVGCPRLLIQYIRSYPPYVEAVSSIRNPRIRHAVVTVDPLNMGNMSLWDTKIFWVYGDGRFLSTKQDMVKSTFNSQKYSSISWTN
jgi:hypothetical protein